MNLFSKLIAYVSDQPFLFVLIRSVIENNFRSIRAIIQRELRFDAGLPMLDLGCGPGTFSGLFKECDYLGIDLNAKYVEYARKKKQGKFLCQDARKIDLPDASFSQVLVFGLLHHLSDEDASAVLREVRRVLKPSALALVIEDIPTLSQLNLLGHLIHRVENGEHIRPVEAYRQLYSSVLRIERDEVLRSGLCDYYAAILRRE